MSPILVVHGGGPHRDASALQVEWSTSMMDGLALAGYPYRLPAPPTIVDLETPRWEPDPDAPERDWTRSTLDEWWRNALFADDRVRDETGAAFDARLAALGRSRFFTGLPPEDLLHALAVLRHLLTGSDVARERVGAVANLIDGRTRVVVGLGVAAIAAADALCRAVAVPASAPVTLITAGVPSGWDVPRPPPFRAWTNLVDPADGLTGGRGLRARCGDVVRDVPLDCDPRLHAVRPYVATTEFGAALGTALGTSPESSR
ncbi:hypothetical protein ACH35V_05430 [Actinomadura sp. 1N219]|uniref:hypothetical protein n=1 Tax=Actinomadura sp. 1N219 TaxID=3375152 RepID=UPI0037AC60D7